MNEQTYHTETSQPVSLTTEGHTRDEAIENLQELAQQCLAAREVIQLATCQS
jgi:predicted RNase H-like HicB family nuclease